MELKTINGKNLIPSEWNPRSNFDEEKLSLLKKSMKGIGLVEPLVVRPTNDGKYLITAGERRWRSDPDRDFVCIVRKENELKAKVSCLVENYVRENIDDVDHEKFISNIFNEGIKQKEWKSYVDMEQQTGIPNDLIAHNVMACEDRKELNLGNSQNVSTWDILDTRPLFEKPKVRRKLLEKRNEHKIKGGGRILQKWTKELNELPEEKGLEILETSDDFEDVKIAVEIYKGIRQPGFFMESDLEKMSRIDLITLRCENIMQITPSMIDMIENDIDRTKAIVILKKTYDYLHKLLIALNKIKVVSINGEKIKKDI